MQSMEVNGDRNADDDDEDEEELVFQYRVGVFNHNILALQII